MFNLRLHRILNHRWWVSSQISVNHELYFFQTHPFSSSYGKRSKSKSLKKQSFTVSYLMKSCGLSKERALLASKRVSFETPGKPDSVLAFMKNHGFTDAQVSVLIRKYPCVLLLNPEETFMPKFKFFESLGLSRSNTISLLTKSQNLLVANVETQIIPQYNLLTGFFKSKDDIIFCIRRYPDMIARQFYAKVAKNIQNFREAGVPEHGILSLLRRQPRSFLSSSDKVKNALEELKKMGFNPLQNLFLCGAHVMMAMNESMWKEKIEHFKTWGVSEDEVMTAFRSNPWCMASSKEQIQRVIEFFVKEMEFRPVDVIKKPILFSLSLEKTIIPRYSVYQVLLSKGLVKKKPTVKTFRYAKNYFLERFVKRNLKSAPELSTLVQIKS